MRKWIEDLEDTFSILQFDDRARFVGMRCMLGGIAKLFVRTVSVYAYDTLLDALVKEFGRRYSTDEVFRQLRARRLRPNCVPVHNSDEGNCGGCPCI